jgi:yapsin 1
MKLQLLSLFSLSALASARFLASTESPDGTFHIGFKAKRGADSRGHDQLLRKRDNTLEVPLDNLYTYYNIELELGTPPQKFDLLIDTGSSDLWVISETNRYCATTAAQFSSSNYFNCSRSGTFAAGDSSTYQFNNSNFFIRYGDGTVAEGDWGMDTLAFSGQKIPNMSFGLGNLTNSTIGVFGIGYTNNEATMSLSKPYSYANFPVRLAQAGIINTPAYSLWLNDINANEGNILFGGVDHAKYSGDLISVPVLKSSASATKPTSFTIAFNSLKFTSGGSSQELLPNTIEALLDSGTSLSYFPKNIAADLLAALDASYSSQIGYYIQSCNLEGSLEYSFNGANISVPFSSLLLPVMSRRGPAYFDNGDPVCAIGILPGSYNFALLGDTFLRNAYVVYDLQNDQIALAQAKANTSDSNIEAIVSTIPSATPASLYSATSGISLLSVTRGVRTMVSTASDGDVQTFTLMSATGSSASKTSSASASKTSANAASTILIKTSLPASALLLVVVFLASFCLVFV